MGWNQNSRLDLLHALFVQHTLSIDAYHENTGDKSLYGGHYYSDKAPGITFLAIPAFAISARISKSLNIKLDSWRGWLLSSWLTTIASVALVTALGGAALFVLLCYIVGRQTAFITTLAVFLGSLPFPYATMLFSHGAVIGLICIALWAICDPRTIRDLTSAQAFSRQADCLSYHNDDVSPTSHWGLRSSLAGVCCGLAISSEYTAAVATAGVLVLAFAAGRLRGAVLALSALPPLLLIPMYNWACFGSPFGFAYHNLALPEFQEMNRGLFGITFPPKASAAYLILFSPERGLFFWSPIFLIAFLGLRFAKMEMPTLFWISISVIIVHIFCIAGYYMPSGASALGPRHLGPLIPFLAILSAMGLAKYPKSGIILGYCSIVLTGLATLVDAMPPDDIQNPLFTWHLPKLLSSGYTHTIGELVGLGFLLNTAVCIFILCVPYLLAALPSGKSPRVGTP